MTKLSRSILVFAVVLALCPAAFAAEFWVVREKSGKCVIVKKKPIDTSMIFKGPFDSRKEAQVARKECAPRGRAAAVEYWVIREPSGTLIIVEERPSDPAVIIKGPFRERKKAEVVVKRAPRSDAVAPERKPAERPKAVPEWTKPSEKSVPGDAKPTEGVKSPPSSGERPGMMKPTEKPPSSSGEKPGASSKEEKPQQTKE